MRRAAELPKEYAASLLKQQMDLVAETGMDVQCVRAMGTEEMAHWLLWLSLRRQEQHRMLATAMAAALGGVGARR